MTNSMFGQGQKRVCSWDYSHSSDPKKIRLNYSESQPLDDRQRLRHGPILERSRNNQYVAGICKGKLKTSAFNNSYVQRMQQVQPSFSEKTGTRQMAPYKETNTISGIIPNSQNSFSLIDKSISEQRMLPRQSVGLQKGEGQFKTSETSHHRQSVTSFKVKQDDNSSQGCYSGFSQENYKAGASRFDVHNSRGSSFDSRMQPFQLNTYGKYDKASSHWVDNPCNKGSSLCLDDETSKRCDSQYDTHSSQWKNPSSQSSSQHGQSYKESDSLYGKKPPEWNEDSSCQQNLQYKDSYKRYVSWYCEKPSALNVDPSNWPELQYKASFLKYDGWDGEKPSQRIDDSSNWQSSQYGNNSKKYGSQYSENHPEWNDEPQSQSSQYDVTYNKCDTGCVERLPDGNDLPSTHQGLQYGVNYKTRDTGYGEKLPDRNDVCSSHQSSQYGVNYKRCDTGYGEKLPDRNDVCNNKRCDTGYGEKLSDRNDVCSSHHSLLYDVNYKRCDTRYGERLPGRNEVYSSHQRSQYDVNYKRCDTGYGDKLPDRNEFPISNQSSQYGDGDKKNHNQHIEKQSEWNSNPSVHQISQSGDSCKKSCSQNRDSKEPSNLQNVVGGTPETSYEKLKIQSGVPLENTKKISPSTRSSSISSQSAETFIGDELIATNYGENEEKAKNNVGFTVWQQFSKTHPVIQIVSDLEADAANWITYEEIVRKSKEMVTGRMYFPSFMQRSTQVILDFINDLAEKETIRQLIIAPDMPKSEKHEILQYIKNMPYLQLEKRSSDAGEYTVIFWKSLPVSFILDALKDASNIKSARYRYAPYSVINSKVEMDVSFTDSSNIKELKSNSESEMDASKNPEANSKGIVFSKHWCNNQQKSEDNDLVGETNSDLKTAKSGFKDSVRPRSKLPSKKSNSTGLKSHLISRVGSSDRYKSDTKSRDSNLRESSSSRHKSGSLARRESTRLESDKGRSLDRYRSYTRSRHSNQSEGASSRHKSGSAASLKSYKAGGSDRYKSDTRSRDSVSDKFKSHSDFGRRKPRKKKSFNTVPYIPDPKLMKQGFYKSSCSTIKGSMGNNLVSLCADSVSGRNKSCSNPQKEESSTIAVASDIKHRSDSQQKSEDNNPVTRSDSDLSEGEILSEDDDVSIPNVIVLDDEFVSSCPDSVSARNKSDSDSPKEENGTIAAPSDIKHESDSQQKSEDNNPVTQSDSDLSEGEILSEDDDVSISNVIVLDDI